MLPLILQVNPAAVPPARGMTDTMKSVYVVFRTVTVSVIGWPTVVVAVVGDMAMVTTRGSDGFVRELDSLLPPQAEEIINNIIATRAAGKKR